MRHRRSSTQVNEVRIEERKEGRKDAKKEGRKKIRIERCIEERKE